jgi:hypothetical protein
MGLLSPVRATNSEAFCFVNNLVIVYVAPVLSARKQAAAAREVLLLLLLQPQANAVRSTETMI